MPKEYFEHLLDTCSFIVFLISAYEIAFFSGYIKKSEKSPAMIWAKAKYPKIPIVLVYICIFVILNQLVRFANDLLG